MSTSTTRRRPRALLAVAGALAVLAGLLSPATAQAATYPKPELTSVKAISGAGALKVSWRGVASGGAYATTYRVWYGKSSTFSKASSKLVDLTTGGATRNAQGAVTAHNNNKSTTSPYYILTGLDPKTTYYVWVQPWNTATDKSSGPVSARKSAKTSKYGYSAPLTVTAANANKTSVELTWRTVTGAPTYRVKAKSSSHTVYRSSGAEGNMVVTGLKPNNSYTFTVSVEQPPVSGIPAYIKMSGESKAKATAKTLASSMMDAPRGLATRDDPNSQFDKNGQLPTSIALTWVAPAGFDPATDRFQVDYAKDQEMKSGKGSYVFTTLGNGNTANTYAPYPELSIDGKSTQTTGGLEPQQGAEPQPEPSPTPSGTPSSTPSATPSSTPSQTPSPSVTASPEETTAAPEPTTAEPQETTAAPEPTPTGTEPTDSDDPGDGTVLSAPIRPLAANPGPVRYWGRVKGLASNENWYLRIKVLRKNANTGDWETKSERTEALMGKTLSPKGFLTGKVILPENTKASEFVVGAYKGKDLHDQAALKPSKDGTYGTYQLSVRPGTYYVKATYIGAGNFTDRWATKSGTGGLNRTYPEGPATGYEVKKAASGYPVADIRPEVGKTIKGDIDCQDAPSGKCTVDVAAMSNWGGTSTVIRTVQSDSNGGYTLDGLPAGKYKLRVTHAEDRYKALTVSADASKGSLTGKNGTLKPRAWVKKYTTKISGTKRVGSTLKLSSKAWIASELPVVRAVPKCQWQRNGVDIAGATKCSYKLTSADRGKSVRVKVHNYRYGFESNTTYSKAYRIS